MPGRPKTTAPRGYVTLDEAAELSGLSRATVHRRIQGEEVPATLDEHGALLIARRDVKRLKHRPDGQQDSAGRKPVQLRPGLDQYAAWKREARRRGLKVSQLASRLMDAAAGWKR